MDKITKSTNVADAVGELATSLDTVWVLLAACLVMFMQPGFAMVEAGFTRSKNTINILMKNMMDFSIGSLSFWFIGFSLMFGTPLGGFIGSPNLLFSAEYGNDIPDMAVLFFQTVFAATAATIVSGAVAERTEFKSYLIFSVVICTIIYPISGHWIWGSGWLSKLGFHDFAGSTVVHTLGGCLGLVGAWFVGPRKEKYNGTAKAIPGHNITLGALGVFILWFGWFGFNPGSQLAASGTENARAISSIFITTNLAAASGAVTSMIVSWVRYKRPQLSMTLNGALAGLVAITAGCDSVTPGGAAIIGIIAGIILVFSVEIIDKVFHIDDPVGAVSVHGVCGALGTLLVGLFATDGGLFYGGGFRLLGIQSIGVLTVVVWALGSGYIMFKTIKSTIGLRVSKRVEEEGLDIYEHGETAYN